MELQKPNIEAEVYNNNKKMWLRKKKFKSLIGFLSVNKIDKYNRGGGKEMKKEKKNPTESTEQVKKIRIINVFLESLLSESFPSLGVTVHLTSLGCPLTLYWSLDLLWGQLRF